MRIRSQVVSFLFIYLFFGVFRKAMCLKSHAVTSQEFNTTSDTVLLYRIRESKATRLIFLYL